jgi:hypothetical protein
MEWKCIQFFFNLDGTWMEIDQSDDTSFASPSLHSRKLEFKFVYEIMMNTHKFWREIKLTKYYFWEERRVLPFVLHYYIQLYCEGD